MSVMTELPADEIQAPTCPGPGNVPPGASGGSGQRIRVAQVVLNLQVGGMEKLLVEFARQVDLARFDFRFVSLQARGP